jgi:hypothetical protein
VSGESEGRFPTERGACRAQDFEDASVGDHPYFALEGNGVDSGQTVGSEQGAKDLLDVGAASDDWTEVRVLHATLGS